MTYTLSKVSENASIAKYHIFDDLGVCGSVSCALENEAALLAHWRDAPRPAASAASTARKNPMVAAILRAAPRNKPSRQAILRACC
jgi:hypothetical protein